MNRWSLAVMIIAIAACSGHHDPAAAKVKAGSNGSAANGPDGSGDLKMHRAQAGTRDANGWYPAHSDAGRFSVLMPAPFNDFSLDSLTEKGAALVMDAIGTQLADGVKFSAICNRGGDVSPTEALKTVPAGMRVTPVHLTFKGHEAIEMRSTDPVGLMRAIALPNQVCLLIVDPQGASKVIPDRDAKIMFESFTPDP